MDTRDGGIPGNAGVKSRLGARLNSNNKKESDWMGITAAELGKHAFYFTLGYEEDRVMALVRQAEAEAADYLERMGK